MTSPFDAPFDVGRHRIYGARRREAVILRACSPSYQRFLRGRLARCIVVDEVGHTVIVIAGKVKVGQDPPMSIREFLARASQGLRPWERPAVTTSEHPARDEELLARFAREIETVLADEGDEPSESPSFPRRFP